MAFLLTVTRHHGLGRSPFLRGADIGVAEDDSAAISSCIVNTLQVYFQASRQALGGDEGSKPFVARIRALYIRQKRLVFVVHKHIA